MIFLYLIDNETSWVILFSAGTGLMIEIWKVKKAMDVHRIPSFPFIQLCYKQTYKTETLKYVCICVSMYRCMYICMYVHTNTHIYVAQPPAMEYQLCYKQSYKTDTLTCASLPVRHT